MNKVLIYLSILMILSCQSKYYDPIFFSKIICTDLPKDVEVLDVQYYGGIDFVRTLVLKINSQSEYDSFVDELISKNCNDIELEDCGCWDYYKRMYIYRTPKSVINTGYHLNVEFSRTTNLSSTKKIKTIG